MLCHNRHLQLRLQTQNGVLNTTEKSNLSVQSSAGSHLDASRAWLTLTHPHGAPPDTAPAPLSHLTEGSEQRRQLRL